MIAAPIHLNGHRLMLDPAGALWWPERRLLAVADLHFEKGSACAARGHPVPPWDTHATLERLHLLLRRYGPHTVLALGDSFHDRHAAGRLMAGDAARLAAMVGAQDWVWLLGNHDPLPPVDLPGVTAEWWEADGIVFRHQAGLPRFTGPGAEVCGHHHPKASVVTRGATVTRPCFVAGPHRLMLPAFGAYTGGLDVRSPAISGLFPRGARAFLLGKERLFAFSLGQGAAMQMGGV